MSKKPRNKLLLLLVLHILLGVYAFSDVLSKLAAGTSIDNIQFYILYGLILVALGIYAIGWQQVIKRMNLSTAYSNRAITIVWGIFWGAVLFDETISLGNIVGALLIIIGIILFVRADKEDESELGL